MDIIAHYAAIAAAKIREHGNQHCEIRTHFALRNFGVDFEFPAFHRLYVGIATRRHRHDSFDSST